jgi:hypothetical protein
MNGMTAANVAAGANQAARIKLVKPSEASAEVAAIFEDIKATKGANFLTRIRRY